MDHPGSYVDHPRQLVMSLDTCPGDMERACRYLALDGQFTVSLCKFKIWTTNDVIDPSKPLIVTFMVFFQL